MTKRALSSNHGGSPSRVLITGGAGFIGSHLADHLIKDGYRVRVFDALDPQVHRKKTWPSYLNPRAEKIRGDICNRAHLKDVLQGVDVVVHLAAAVGVGQSMYQVQHYTRANILGTSVLWDILANERHRVKKVVVASSMSAYGEGFYCCPTCGLQRGNPRPEEQLKQKRWEPECPRCGKILLPAPIPESEPFHCYSVYASTKKFQEELSIMLGKVYGISSTALRFFNIYGSRQSLSNPYTGVAAIFLSRIKNNLPPIVYEDGGQTRDFVSVHDVVRAIAISMTRKEADFETFNVGSGASTSVRALAQLLAKEMSSRIEPRMAETFRIGDIRHCTADISRIQDRLGWRPEISLEQGMQDLCHWAADAESADFFEEASRQLAKRGLLR